MSTVLFLTLMMTVPRGALATMDATTECLSSFDGVSDALVDGGTVSCTDCDPACDSDSPGQANGSCTFNVAVCLNQPRGTCTATTIKSSKVKPKKLGIIPADPCGQLTPVVVQTKRGGRRPGRVVLTSKVISTDRPRKVDIDRLELICAPRPAGDSCPTTSTTSPTTTTTSSTEAGTTTTSTTQAASTTTSTTQAGTTTTSTTEAATTTTSTTEAGSTTTTEAGSTTTTEAGSTTTTEAGSTTTTEAASTTTTTLGPTCCDFTQLQFTTALPQIDVDPPCGSVTPGVCILPGLGASGAACTSNADCPSNPSGTEFCMGDIDCGGLYFGGAGVSVPLPSVVPDMGGSVTNMTGCNAETGTFTITGTSVAEAGTIRTCTSGTELNPEYPACVGGATPGRPCRADPDCSPGTCTGQQLGCLFGPPLPVPNANVPATSNCIINRIVTTASGSGSCDGDTALSFNLLSDLYLAGDALPSLPGLQPCPVCLDDACVGGPNNGLECAPGSSASLGDAYPTSHDCPPAAPQFIGSLPIPFALTTGATSLTATDKDGPGSQVLAFCGFCRSPVAPNPFRNPPTPCSSNADCTIAPHTACQQRFDGAFGNGIATTITATGAAPTESLVDGQPHDSTLVSIFCIPPSYNGLVDSAADLPGPGAVALIGQAQLLP